MGRKYKLMKSFSSRGERLEQKLPELIQEHKSLNGVRDYLQDEGYGTFGLPSISHQLKKLGWSFSWSEGWYKVPDDVLYKEYVIRGTPEDVAQHFDIHVKCVTDALLRKLQDDR